MNRLILLIVLLTASVAFGHENEHDPKHNAIHDSYVGKICHAHTYGNDTVQGDLHWHENSYRFSDDDHNQKLSNYYLDLHDVNNPNNLTHFERFVIHGLHTLDYIVTPPVQIDGKSVGKSVENTPDATLKAIDKPKKAYVQCPLGWQTGASELLIGAIGFEWITEERGYYVIKSVEIYSQTPNYDLSGFRLQVKPLYAHHSTKTAINAPTNDFGFLRVVLPSPIRVNITGLALMGFDTLLLTPDGKRVDNAVTCYPIYTSKQAFRESGRIERIIPNAYGVDVGLLSLLGSEWNDYYRSSWKVIGVASAPTLQKPKLTTMWAELKQK